MNKRGVHNMGKRIYPRYNVSNLGIPLDVIDCYNEPTHGTLRDISVSGISFYTYEKTLITASDNVVDVILISKMTYYVFEVEILREEKSDNGKMIHAGRLLGVPSAISNEILRDLTQRARKRELVFV